MSNKVVKPKSVKRIAERRVDCSLNDALIRLKFRTQRPQEDLLSILINLAGDVDRFLQRTTINDQEGVDRELGNIRSRLNDLKEACK